MKLDPFTNRTNQKVSILDFAEIYQNQYPRVWIIRLLIDDTEFNVEIEYEGNRYGALNRVKLIENPKFKDDMLLIGESWGLAFDEMYTASFLFSGWDLGWVVLEI